MIQANELRIGNLFWDEDNTPCYFAGAWQRQDGWIYRDSANNTYKDSQMYPIPLAPEILEKAGFVHGYVRLELNLEGFSFGKSLIDDHVLLYDHNNYNTGVSAKYLHQLQNLYFALTGQELEIKL